MRSFVRRDRVIVVLLLVVVVVLPVLVIFVAPISLKAYDLAHPIEVRCDVTSATRGTSSSHSYKGIGSSLNEVVIESSDCGTLVLRWQVSSQNKRTIATRLDRGGAYSFTIGAGSWKLRALLHTVRQAVYVRGYERVS